MKRYLLLLLAIACLLQPCWALSFSDLDEAPWAEDYILKLAKAEIVMGFQDGSYKPLDSVSYYAAVLVLYRTLDAQGLIDAAAVDIYVNRYRAVIDEVAVPDWPDLDRAIGYMLENGIVDAAELKLFRSGEVDQPIPRQKMARYMARAWNIFWGEALDRPIESNFKDDGAIAESCRNEVELLYRHGIIAGDDEGNFKPTASLNRAELAKLIVTGIAALKQTEQVVSNQIDAYVYVKLDETKKIVFYQTDSKTKSYVEHIDESVTITIDGKRADYRALKLQQPVVLVYANDKLIAIRVGRVYDDIDGDSVVGRLTDTVTDGIVRYIYIASGQPETVQSYRLAATAIIVKDGHQIEFSALPIDAQLALTVTGDVVALIECQ